MRVLIVDDCVDSAFLLAELLKKLSYEAKWTHESHVALEIAASWRPEVIFVDLAMPQENGYVLSRRLRTEVGLDSALIVAISGYTDDRVRRRAAGIDAHLLKPASFSSVQEIIENEEHRRAMVADSFAIEPAAISSAGLAPKGLDS